MGVAASRRCMCCSLRDKQGFGDGIMDGRPPQFQCLEVGVQLDCPVMVAFAPLHQREASCLRRLAAANAHEVHVYRILESDPGDLGAPPKFVLTHTMKLDPGTVVNGILFSDEDSSRQLLVSTGPEGGEHGRQYSVKVWSCEQIPGWLPQVLPSSTPGDSTPPPRETTPAVVVEWKEHEGYVASIDEHKAPVMRLATNKTYLLTADGVGECRLWQRNRGFARRAVASLHTGGVSDLIVDRLWAYSAGCEDRRICVWTLPELSPVLSIAVDLPEDLVMGARPRHLALPRLEAEEGTEQAASLEATTGSAAPNSPQCQLSRINLLQRPLSRWAGWQGSARGTKAPRGSLFVAGVLGEGCEIAGAGAGMLMQWTLGDTATCQSAQIAHDTPIVSLVYGPYDNGPLITADAKGIFRVWELLLERGLCLSQQLEVPGVRIDLAANGIHCPAVAVEQPQGLYVAAGAPSLLVWQRHQGDGAGGLSRM